ncbi:GNAT family N-acetyltransferase [Bradyrhizobium oligotrophicum]|uniref:GNAT family N-acetyltransferase n=1 Tax=Bradyrhizobium oligotrophicum TaxID=44255 RepID=UPI003EBC7A67
MTSGDLAAIDTIAARVHPDYPENLSVFAERLRLHPQGCRVLISGAGAMAGYVISHPWHLDAPPALNVLLGRIPSPAATYYIHDLALLAEARGRGAASGIVNALVAHARELRLPSLSLIAVNGSTPFWESQGFAVDQAVCAGRRPISYGDDAMPMIRYLI